MNDQYYYTIDGKRHGPTSFAALRELANKGELKRRDKIWCKSMKEWQPAGSVGELFSDLPPDLESETTRENPPPLPKQELSTTKNNEPTTVVEPTTQSGKQRSPGLVALASLILPGLGQMICGQDAKGLFILFVSIGGNFLTGGLSSLLLCPLMAVDGYTIAKKSNGGPVEKWEFFPSAPSINKLAPHVIPGVILAVVLLFIVIIKLEESREQDARLQQSQEKVIELFQEAQQHRGY